MSRRFKRPKTHGPYIPKRAGANEIALRKVAAVIFNQAQLNSYLAQVGTRHPAPQQREIQIRSFQLLRSYLTFDAEIPLFLQDESGVQSA